MKLPFLVFIVLSVLNCFVSAQEIPSATATGWRASGLQNKGPIFRIVADPKGKGLWACSSRAVYLSIDEDDRWSEVYRGADGEITGMEVTQRGVLLSTRTQGILKTEDEGKLWKPIFEEPFTALPFNHLSANDRGEVAAVVHQWSPYAKSDSETLVPINEFYLSSDQGKFWKRVYPTENQGVHTSSILVDQRGTIFILFEKRPLFLVSAEGRPFSELPLPGVDEKPKIVEGASGHYYASGPHLFYSADLGKNWERMSLTAYGIPQGGRLTLFADARGMYVAQSLEGNEQDRLYFLGAKSKEESLVGCSPEFGCYADFTTILGVASRGFARWVATDTGVFRVVPRSSGRLKVLIAPKGGGTVRVFNQDSNHLQFCEEDQVFENASSRRLSWGTGDRITLIAEPLAGFSFTGWSGGCENKETRCELKLVQETEVTAHFEPHPR
jgi:Divergent InlB B-repeat domain